MGPPRPVGLIMPGRFLRSCRENGETRNAGENSPAFFFDSAAARIARLTTGLISCLPPTICRVSAEGLACRNSTGFDRGI